MLQRARTFFERYLGRHPEETDDVRRRRLQLAVAALVVEMLEADQASSPGERRRALESLRQLLGLEREACDQLLDLAEREIDQAHDLYQFTSEINRSYSHDEKQGLVEQLWRVARADDVVHKYEEHLVRRVAELLHVSHREFIAAKLRSEQQR